MFENHQKYLILQAGERSELRNLSTQQTGVKTIILKINILRSQSCRNETFLSDFQTVCIFYFASYELEEVLKRQMSPADTLFENRGSHCCFLRSAKWLRTKKELMEAFLRAEKKKKDSQPHQPRKLQYTYHLAMLSSSSTLTTLLV